MSSSPDEIRHLMQGGRDERPPITAEIRAAYRLGKWRCEVPPVCTAQWDEDAWIRFIGERELLASVAR